MGKALNNFTNISERAEKLVEASSESKGSLSEELLRAAVILIVSGMDAYFKEAFMNNFFDYVKKKSDYKLYAKIAEKYGHYKMESLLEILPQKRPNRTVISHIRKNLYLTPMHNTLVINELYQNFGIKNLAHNAANKTGKKKNLSIVMNAVARRHKIAHNGDRKPHGKLETIEKKYVEHWINHICLFVESADSIIHSALK